MRFAALLRHRRLLMNLSPSTSSSATPSLKRPFVAQATALALAETSQSLSDSLRPSKSAKRHGAQTPQDRQMPAPSSSRGSGARSSRPGGGRRQGQDSKQDSRRSGGGGRSRQPQKSALPELDGPMHNSQYLLSTQVKPLKPAYLDNPKSPLNNYVTEVLNEALQYTVQDGRVGSFTVMRATVTIVTSGGNITGIGDASSRKEAEKLAALHAVIQLNELNLLDISRAIKSQNTPVPGTPAEAPRLTDGSAITFDKARQFMDYYCRRFHFPKEDITWEEARPDPRGRSRRPRGNSQWEAVMTVGGRRIGMGTANSKKDATNACYVDVVQYLESCDPELWKQFAAAAKTGKDLGLAQRVHLYMSDRLDDDIRDLCYDVKKSNLYQNRPLSSAANLAPTEEARSRAAPRHTAAYFPQKSETLKKRRQAYLGNSAMERMRNTRASLPVFTRSEELLQLINEHEVIICMAATGSGKTTQIPQIILDHFIDQDKGSRCNIICTQPRRLAAISVADRVAKERGETVGRGSIGYQVRFEAKLPEDHGSVTFCTTGIFLKRMQSALLEGGSASGHSFDDVTHVIVDEVHERDVDTDLLLVVLKRLLADRKSKGKPIKVILMSATIDPTLFRQYFLNEQGQPAPVIDIPGRSFPVDKHYLDEFLPQVARRSEANWVLRDKDVVKYLQNEMDAQALIPLHITPSPEGRASDDDIPLPAPLVALTVAHVLQQSSDGHVLVFLPGWDDITSVERCLNEKPLGLPFTDSKKYSVHKLHSTVPLAEQQVIFDPPPEGVRRIILATNIAETSVTIPDVVYVVDTAKVKEQRYDPDRHMSSLVSAWVGSSNLNQRAGRAGRHRPGEYFGVLTRKRAESLHPYQMVEMKRVDLTNVVMHVKALNFPGMSVEEVLEATIEPPASERVIAAMQDLKMTGALDEEKNLTSLGRVLLQLPVEVQMGRLVLFGCFFRCLDQALTLAAILTNRDPFVSPMHLKKESSEVKNSWTVPDFRSDALATLRAYDAWWAMQGNGEYVRANRFTSENFLAKPTLLMIEKIKRHLLQALRHAGVLDISATATNGTYQPPGRRRDDSVPSELNSNANNWPLLCALIAIGSQPKFAVREGQMTYRTQQDKTVLIHPSSVNNRKREDNADRQEEKQILAFAEKRQNVSTAGSSSEKASKFMVTTTRLDPLSYLLFGAYNIAVTERGLECDDWLPVVGSLDALDDIQRLKYLMEGCMLRVFEGITFQRHRQQYTNRANHRRHDEQKEDESDDDDDDNVSKKDRSLSTTETRELGRFTEDIVRILNRFTEERIANQSRHNSRPATPMNGSPSSGVARLPALGGRSGYNSPLGGRSAFNSRPGTPGIGPSPLRNF